MVMNKNVLVRFSESQYKQLRTNSEIRGHKTVSSFIRDSCLKHSYVLEQDVKYIRNKIDFLEGLIRLLDDKGKLLNIRKKEEKYDSSPEWMKILKKIKES